MLARSSFSPHYWWAWLCVYGFFITYGVAEVVIGHRQAVPILVLGIIFSIVFIAAIAHSARIDAKRQEAFQHLALTPTLPIQPYDPDTLTLPLRLVWRPTWRGIVVAVGMISVSTIAIVILLGITSKTPSHAYLSINTWVIALLFAVLFMEFILAFTLRASNPAFSAWDKGIALGWRRYLDYSALLLWRDAKFFAVRATFHGMPTQYEVSGEHRIIIFGRLRPGSLAAFFFRPPMPLPEYDALMDDLIAYIAARTKLPLVDLTQM